MRKKRTSEILDKAEKRASAILSIQENLDLGNGLTLEAYWAEIETVREKQKLYNTTLSSLDHLYSELKAEEQVLREMSEHMLSGVKVKFGRDSYEYEMAGGVRYSERKSPHRRVKAGATA